MARKVTVTFDNGAQHTYEDVPDSATPESVLERTRRDFGERGVTNIDGGREKGGRDYVMDLGKGAASLADTALNAVTGTLDYGAYALARAAGRSPEQAQAETTSPKDVIGGAFGITQDPAYRNEASRRAMGAVGAGIEQYAVKPLASSTGLPEQDVANMVNTGMIGAAPGIARGAAATGRAAVGGAQAVGRGAAEVARAPVNFGKGFYEGVMNPEPTPSSALVPLQKQAYPAQAGRDFVSGRMSLPELEASRVPSASLFSGRLDQAALKALPKNTAGQPMVPLAGRGMEAVGENLGRGYRTQPLQAAADLGLMSLGVPPIGPAARAAQGVASLRAGKAADFTPGFTERLGQAQTQAALAPNPQLRLPAPTAPAPGPVNPATMYAGAGGTSPNIQQAGQAALQQKYAPQPATTQQAVQQAAAARVQGLPQVAPQRGPRRGPQNVSQMMVPEELGGPRNVGGSWDNPLSHDAAMKQVTMNGLSNKPNNIVGQSADGSVKYTLRDHKNGQTSLTYDIVDPVTGKEIYSVERNKWPTPDGSVNTIVKNTNGYDYVFSKGKLSKIVEPNGRAHTPNMESFKKQPTITEPDVMRLIQQIKE